MTLRFVKYHGAGNDFVMINNLQNALPSMSEPLVKMLCARRFGIGADGLIVIEPSSKADFKMVYYNADGKVGSMCGNGSRCAVLYANELGIDKSNGTLEAYDGIHRFEVLAKSRARVSMSDVTEVLRRERSFMVDTGSPHVVLPVDNVDDVDVYAEGKKIRNSSAFKDNGVNVNFIEAHDHAVKIRTYERGVEDETLACGTGCVAAAIAASLQANDGSPQQTYQLLARGGALSVSFEREAGKGFRNVWLEGPVEKVFEGFVTA